MPDPEIPAPAETPAAPGPPREDPAADPLEMPAPPPSPGQDGDGRAYDQL